MAREAPDLLDGTWEPQDITSHAQMSDVEVQKLKPSRSAACKRHEGALVLYLASAGPVL